MNSVSTRKVLIEPTFDNFDPHHYLKTYYSKVGSENEALLDFFAKCFKDLKKTSVMLEFGGGPTIYQIISAAPKVRSIHFADHLERNLNEVKLWKENSPNAFNWNKFIKKALYLEGNKRVSKKKITFRGKMVRKKITKFLYCDAFKRDPIDKKYRNYYDIVSINFVAESITNNKEMWETIISNVCSLLKKNGILIMTAIKNADYYHVGKKAFPATSITEEDILNVLTKLEFEETSFFSYSVPAEISEELVGYTGYKGIIFIKAEKKV